MIKVAILGYGTVGSGVVEVLTTNAGIIAKRAGQEVDRKSTRQNSSHNTTSRMPSSA